ncbi:MAG: low molecular weight phosphatase family protein [Roseiflexaceae bacterium]
MADRQQVLFVCTGNYYRSRYAEHVFNHYAAGSPWQADSRGFEPSPLNPGPINATAAQRLAAAGMAPPQFRDPIRINQADLEQANLIIMLDEQEHRPYMHERFPDWENRVRYWQIADLWAMTTDQALSAIDREVQQLWAELQQK